MLYYKYMDIIINYLYMKGLFFFSINNSSYLLIFTTKFSRDVHMEVLKQWQSIKLLKESKIYFIEVNGMCIMSVTNRYINSCL